MQREAAKKLITDTFEQPFDKGQFTKFCKNLLNRIDPDRFTYRGNYIFADFRNTVDVLERIGKYEDADGNKVDILVVHLKKTTSLERARASQRKFIAKYLKGSRGNELKDAALVAFVSPNEDDWRFSFIKMDYKIETTEKGRVKVKEELTPARRYSFLVGKNENSHTAQSQLLPILQNTDKNPKLADLEAAFRIEKVTKEFFEQYRELYLKVKDALDALVAKDKEIRADFESKGVDTVDFAKKLLGQIVFLYFLQKKGWFGVKRKAAWGTGSKAFLRELFLGNHGKFNNFFNDILEPLFYNTLAVERSENYADRFDCKIPFLNGGLFDPLNNYDWVDTDILLSNELFSNDEKTKQGDTGTGILDVFDRYNFTVKEDEPLEKEVAVDPEMLGKVFENLLEVKDRKSKGTYYTPREIVHYMCQESLINHLATELESNVPREDIETLIKHGETAQENDTLVNERGEERGRYKYKLPESIRDNAEAIDQKLADIKVCDPAVGSGAFLVGMMSEIVRTRMVLTQFLGNGERTAYDLKRHAIQNSLYGVDIDLGAVEIAKLRLWLSLIVDEDDYKQIKPLPNLDYKIMQGNSLLEDYEGIKLIDERFFEKQEEKAIVRQRLERDQSKIQREYIQLNTDRKLTKVRKAEFEKRLKEIDKALKELDKPWSNGQDELGLYGKSEILSKADKLLELHEQFFSAHNKRLKDQLKRQIDVLTWDLIETTLKEQRESEKLKDVRRFQQTNTRPFFLWRLNFAEVFSANDGFDVVIANPPYVNAMEMKRSYQASILRGYRANYESAVGALDIYILFFEQGIRILASRGMLAFITPNKYLSASYAKAFRNYCISHVSIHQFVDLSNIPVFQEVSVYPILTFLLKGTAESEFFTLRPVPPQLESVRSESFSRQAFPSASLTTLPENLWGYVLSSHYPILRSVERKSMPLEQFARVRATSTAKESDDFTKYIGLNQKPDTKKLVNTGTIDRFVSLWGKQPMRHKGQSYATPYLDMTANIPASRRKVYDSPKVIFAKMAKRVEAFADIEGEYASLNTNCAYGPDVDRLLFLCGFVNSKLFQFVYAEYFGGSRMSGGYFQFQAPQLRVMPFPSDHAGFAQEICQLTRQIAERSSSGTGCASLDRAIDDLVYRMYDLDQQSIAVIEESVD